MKHSDIAHFRQLNSLRRRFVARNRRFPPVIEPAAMVDVVLLALLFFILQSPMVTRQGVQLQLPVSSHAEAVAMRAMVVTLTGDELVFFNNHKLSMQELPETLRRARTENPERSLVIESDERMQLNVVMSVYRIAAAAGFEEIAMATRGAPPGEAP